MTPHRCPVCAGYLKTTKDRLGNVATWYLCYCPDCNMERTIPVQSTSRSSARKLFASKYELEMGR